MAVVMQHFSATAQRLSAVTIPSLVPHGYLGVDLFFVLSGFIMSYTYLASFESAGLRAFPAFLGKRVARVVPLNVAVLMSLMVLAAISTNLLGRNIFFNSNNVPFDLVANLLMLQGLGVGTNLNGPSWSISTEFAAYLLFPLYVILIFHARAAVWIPALSIAVGLLCWQAFLHPRLGLASEAIADQVIRCFTQFGIGMGAYRLSCHPRMASLLGSDRVAFGLVGGCLFFLALRVDLPVALLFPFLIVSFANNKGRMERLMSHPAPYFLGVISYSIYLIHNPFRPMWLEVFHALHLAPLSAPAALAFALVGSLCVIPFAWVAYRLVERPGRAVVRRLLTGSPPVRQE